MLFHSGNSSEEELLLIILFFEFIISITEFTTHPEWNIYVFYLFTVHICLMYLCFMLHSFLSCDFGLCFTRFHVTLFYVSLFLICNFCSMFHFFCRAIHFVILKTASKVIMLTLQSINKYLFKARPNRQNRFEFLPLFVKTDCKSNQ